MRTLRILLSLGLLSQSAFSQVRSVVIEAPPLAPGQGFSPAVGAQALPRDLTLPPMSLGAPSVLPGLKSQGVAPAAGLSAPGEALPSLSLPVSRVAAPAASPVRPEKAVLPAAQAPKTPFEKKLQAVSSAVQEAGKELDRPGADDGRQAAERQFQALTGETFEELLDESLSGGLRPAQEQGDGPGNLIEDAAQAEHSPRQARRVERTNLLLETAVSDAVKTFLAEPVEVRSRGSSARMTYTGDSPDYDLMVKLPADVQTDSFMRDNLKAIKAAIEASARRGLAGPDEEVVVTGPKGLNDPATGAHVEGVYLLELHVVDKNTRRILVDADVTFASREDYANAYPDYFQAQMDRARAAGGDKAVSRLLRDIRLAKLLFIALIGSYKPWHGGPSGVGVEQMVVQAGGFDSMMDRVYEAAFQEDGTPRGLKKASRLWKVENPFMQPSNFVDLLSDGAWKQLAHAAKKYRQARLTGRPVRLSELRREKEAPVRFEKPKEPEIAVTEAGPLLQVTIPFSTRLKLNKLAPLAKGMHAKVVRDRAVMLLEPGADPGTAAKTFAAALLKADPGARIGEPSVAASAFDVMLRLRPRMRGPDSLRRLLRGLSRRFGLKQPSLSMGADGTLGIRFSGQVEDRQAFVKLAADYLRSRSESLAGVVFPAGPKGAEVAGRSLVEEPGSLTLEMLKKFTLSGPRPESRGDAYLYAQGAKVLPGGLEAARPEPSKESGTEGGESQRSILYRRNGRVYVLVQTHDEEGFPKMKPMNIPARMTQGIVSDTLVEVRFDGKTVRSVRSIGAYAADMLIGRVSGKTLVPLFDSEGPVRRLYEPLPLASAAKEGRIVQAFVRRAASGFEAVPLLDLGDRITPEIAAREIALRHGARGYFDEAVLRQAEDIGRAQAPSIEAADMRSLPFVTIDPVGAGDLDDAYYIEKAADGSYTWYLATADVAQYERPGTPAFRAAARIGNTFYSIDKDGVPEYPMNHPVVSKYVASLLAGKDSLAMVTKMRFSPSGEFLLDQSEVFLGKVRVAGRYTYDQVAALWKGGKDHGVRHVDQVALARELSDKLTRQDTDRGKLKLSFTHTAHRPEPDGRWTTEVEREDPLLSESHRLIEELKVYGNRVIATRLNSISREAGVPHISRVHPPQDETVNERLREELSSLGAPWPEGKPLWQYLDGLRIRKDLRPEVKESAQWLALMSRNHAVYALDDAEGHEGLALRAEEYDHPSTPIRRFSDMYNRAILEASLEGGDPKAVYEAVLKDVQDMGFADLKEYMEHLNGREQAAGQMDREVDEFMSVYMLSQPENAGRTFSGYVKIARGGRNAQVTIQLREIPAFIILKGEDARSYRLMDEVSVTVRGADVERLKVDAKITRSR
ncbi:MAG: RNB domain-containing ribonuclease [Elusimicrobiota bacterium]